MNSSKFPLGSADLLERLAHSTNLLDRTAEWPSEQFQWLADSDVLRWVIPSEYGGVPISQEELIEGYQQLATACLTTTFVLTQRNGACQRIAGSDNDDLKAELLPQLADGVTFATVGISHLTTSRQHLRTPTVRVTDRGDVLELGGTVPWVTGACQADYVVTGGTCDDSRQVLIVLPTRTAGVTIEPAARLLALTASQTASINLQDVLVDRRYLIAGPIEGVMQTGSGGGTGSVATSALAVGLARRSIDLLAGEAARRPELMAVVEPFVVELQSLRGDLSVASCDDDSPRRTAESIRQRANSLCLRSSQALLAASKGAGFVVGHPAEQAVREAMFFLVWSCPQPVLTAALQEFACLAN